MNKLACFLLAGLLAAGLCLPADAEQSECVIYAGDAAVLSGQSVTVPILIRANPGLTNFALRLCYNPEELELVCIHTADAAGEPFLCGELTAVNPHRTGEDAAPCGYAVCAMPEVMTRDGVLLTATFRARQGFAGSTAVTPAVEYLRRVDGESTDFLELPVSSAPGSITSVLPGDVSGDGRITAMDPALVYRHVMQGGEFLPTQLLAGDSTGDGKITSVDAAMLYRSVNNTLPGQQTGQEGE